MKRERLITTAAGTLVAVTIAGVAWASIPGPGNVYSACMLKGLGTIRLIDKSLPSTNLMSRCTDKEIEISWNQAGQPGPGGPQGAKGDPGAPGTNGTNGKDGVSVTTSSEPAGAICADGGVQLTAVNGVSYVCNGKAGVDGKDGTNGADGTNGTDGKDGNLALAGRSCPDGSVVTGFDPSGDLVCAAAGEPPPPPPPPPPPGEVRVSPVLMSFPRTQLGTIADAQDVILQNTGELDVSIVIAVAGANATDFIVGEGCRTLLADSLFAPCRLPVQFAPSAFGPRTATIWVHLPTGELRSVALVGEGGS